MALPHSITIDPVEGGDRLDGPFVARCDYCEKEGEPASTRYLAHQQHYKAHGNGCPNNLGLIHSLLNR